MHTLEEIEGGKFFSGQRRMATFVETYEGAKINSDGTLGTAASAGAHVTEWSINTDGTKCTVTYYKTSATGNYGVAYYNGVGTLLGGLPGGGGGSGVTTTVTLPTGTRMVRVFGIEGVTAALSVTNPVVTYDMVEISYGPNLEIVWPTAVEARVVPGSATVVYYGTSGRQYLNASGYQYANDYAQVIATFQDYLGVTPQGQPYTQVVPISFSFNPYIDIDGVSQYLFSITPDYKVTGVNLGTTRFNGPFCRVKAYWNGVAINGDQELQINQSENRPVLLDYKDRNGQDTTTLNGYSITLSGDSLPSSGGSVTLSGNVVYTRSPRYLWNSGRFSYGSQETTSSSQNPTNIAVSPSTGVTVSGTTITFPANGGIDEIDYSVTATYSGKSATAHVGVKGSDTGRVYSQLSIQTYSYGIIPASGGSVYPTVVVRIYCSVNGGDPKLLSGSVNAGQTSVEVSGNGLTATVALTYIGVENGLVSALSRGTNVDDANTVVATGLQVRASKSGMTVTSSSLTVYQQRNQITNTVPGNFNVTSLSVTPKINDEAVSQIDAASTTVALDVRASGSGTTTKYTYTSGAQSGGDYVEMSNEEVTPSSLSVSSGGSPITVTDKQFMASNIHQLTNKSYAISASYEGTSASASLTQLADEKIDTGAPTYYVTLLQLANTNSLWAGGGEVLVRATAYHRYGKKWKSDGAPVSGETSDPIYDTNRIDLNLTQSAGYSYEVADTDPQYKVFRITHRDMTTNVTTDTLSVYAMNGNPNDPSTYADTSASPLTYSVSNALGDTEYPEVGEITWGVNYPGYRNYNISFTVNNYYQSSNPAPFTGATTRYSVSGYHQEALLHDGERPTYYYKRYTSWSADHDDNDHRTLYRTETESITGQLVPGSEWGTVWGDNVTVEKQHPEVTWLSIDTATQTITISAQQEDGRVRYENIVATNVDAPSSVTATKTIWQNAWANLTASPLTYQINWRGTNSAIIDVDARYTKWRITMVGDWYGCSISTDGGITYNPISIDEEYGATDSLAQAKLKFQALSPNDPEHNPNGYTQIRLSSIRLIPLYEGVNSVFLNITQEEYGGGLPTD